jgi:hypothetical protein
VWKGIKRERKTKRRDKKVGKKFFSYFVNENRFSMAKCISGLCVPLAISNLRYTL